MDEIQLATKITLRVLTILGIIALIFVLHRFLFLAFGSWILVIGLDPIVTRLEKFKLPRAISAIVIYIATIAALVGLLSILIPPFVKQGQILTENLPRYFEASIERLPILKGLHIDQFIPLLEQFAQNSSQAIIKTSGDLIRFGQNIVSAFLATLTFFVATLYFLIEYPNISQGLIGLFPEDKRDSIEQTLTIVHMRVAEWMRGQLILAIIVGVMTWIGLVALQMPFALPLSIIAGMLEVVPTIGPILAMVPAVIVSLALSPWKALSTIILYLLIQQIENNLLVPQVMKQTSGLDSLIIIVVLTLGGLYFGFLGILISIPATMVTWTIAEHHLLRRENHEKKDSSKKSASS